MSQGKKNTHHHRQQACEPVQDRCSSLVWPTLSPFLTLEIVDPAGADGIPPRSLSRSRQGCRRLVVIPTGILDFNLWLITSQVAHCEPAAAVHAHAGNDSIETQLVNLGSGNSPKTGASAFTPTSSSSGLSDCAVPCGWCPSKARLLSCSLRMRDTWQFDFPRILPSSAQPRTRP